MPFMSALPSPDIVGIFTLGIVDELDGNLRTGVPDQHSWVLLGNRYVLGAAHQRQNQRQSHKHR